MIRKRKTNQDQSTPILIPRTRSRVIALLVGISAMLGSARPLTSWLYDVIRVGLFVLRCLAVVAERPVTLADRGADAVVRGGLDEVVRLGRVAHQAVQDRAERLGRGDAHVLEGLVDDELLRGELRGRNRAQLL